MINNLSKPPEHVGVHITVFESHQNNKLAHQLTSALEEKFDVAFRGILVAFADSLVLLTFTSIVAHVDLASLFLLSEQRMANVTLQEAVRSIRR
jgi:hypothetical protein